MVWHGTTLEKNEPHIAIVFLLTPPKAKTVLIPPSPPLSWGVRLRGTQLPYHTTNIDQAPPCKESNIPTLALWFVISTLMSDLTVKESRAMLRKAFAEEIFRAEYVGEMETLSPGVDGLVGGLGGMKPKKNLSAVAKTENVTRISPLRVGKFLRRLSLGFTPSQQECKGAAGGSSDSSPEKH